MPNIIRLGGGGNIPPDLGSKNIIINGIYNAKDDNLDGYDKVEVNVPTSGSFGTKTITHNGTYNASEDHYDGYSSVTVNVHADSPGYSMMYPKYCSAFLGFLKFKPILNQRSQANGQILNLLFGEIL